MKQAPIRFIRTGFATLFFLGTAGSGWGGDTEPISLAWQSSFKIVYMDPGTESPVRISANSILASTLPRLSARRPNVVNIESGPGIATITKLVTRLNTLEPADVDPSLDVRVLFVFTRVDGYSAILAADSSGQFEWANIKHELPTLEQRKALWRALPYEVVTEYPGPLRQKTPGEQ